MTDATIAPTTSCPHCGAPATAGDRFCESCGKPLDATSAPAASTSSTPAAGPSPAASAKATPHPGAAPSDITEHTTQPAPAPATAAPPAAPRDGTTCAQCGGTFDDGWCTGCGAKAPDPRDHFTEQPAPWVAGACDKGLRHARNEDAMALAVVGHRALLVVCDGVTNATDSDIASLAAARAARDVLVSGAELADRTVADRATYWTQRLTAAAVAANGAAAEAAARVGPTADPPSCTFVAAVLDGELIIAANIGDSRAYWLPDTGAAVALTTDHSWAAARIAEGVPRAVAEHEPDAHAITRWLGVDAPPGDPTCSVTTAEGDGWLVVCSDGLWNYASEAGALRDIVHSCITAEAADPLGLTEALVAWANAQGGQDNITATLARVTAPRPAP